MKLDDKLYTSHWFNINDKSLVDMNSRDIEEINNLSVLLKQPIRIRRTYPFKSQCGGISIDMVQNNRLLVPRRKKAVLSGGLSTNVCDIFKDVDDWYWVYVCVNWLSWSQYRCDGLDGLSQFLTHLFSNKK